ncbi:MAG TPA: branched-chain amino acid ABC transporter permease [Methylomirabilota bacterium]|jgi:branched-chain amino acid transport system permease protein|nr:branched-chain amino acid ABC transporter permease [Methylomirabilota bacterium]
MTKLRLLALGAAGVVLLLPVLLPHPFVLSIATQAVIWALLAASWDLLSGYTGQVSFGHAGFFALGAYTAAGVSKHLGLSPWLGLVLGAAVAAVVGLGTGFPALRLRGHYLALVTLALAELIRLTAQNWLAVTGGPFGIYDFGSFTGLPATGIPRAQAVYLLVAAIVGAGVGAMLYVCRRTRAGRAFRAIREDEVLAESLGINTTVYKLLAFGLSSGLAGLAGTLYAYYIQLVSPTVATAATTSLVIGMAVFGGLGTIWGPALGALLLYAINEGLRFIGVVYNLVAVGLVIMVFVIFLPRGLAGLRFGRAKHVVAFRAETLPTSRRRGDSS